MKTKADLSLAEIRAVILEIEEIGIENITVDKMKKMSPLYNKITEFYEFFISERTDAQANQILFALKKELRTRLNLPNTVYLI